mgnify:CR=1 FL=1
MTETSAIGDIKSAYPSQYYGQYDTTQTSITTLYAVFDVWNGVSVTGAPLNVLDLPSDGSLVPLTAEQYALAKNASNIWVKDGTLVYAARYYASYDKAAHQPTPVTGWYDTWDMSSVSNVPEASNMIPISESDWNNIDTFRLPIGRGVLNSKIIDYTPPPAPVPLKTQAQSALAIARQTVWDEYSSINENTPDNWVTYLKALMAIANGTDTTSTALPSAPTS